MTDQLTAQIALGAATLVINAAKDGSTTIEIRVNNTTAWRCAAPLEFEHFDNGQRTILTAGYRSLHSAGDSIEAVGQVTLGGAQIEVTDQWRVADGFFRLDRVCRVASDGAGGFNIRTRFQLAQGSPEAVRVFVPGMIYGTSAHLTKVAIGGADVWNADRAFDVIIREDRMPGPIVAMFVPGGANLALFDAAPTGIAPIEDTTDTEGKELIVDGMGLNALGFQGNRDEFVAVFCSPANEGEVTYQGTTYPYGQLRTWRRRFQALRAGAEVRCSAGYRISSEASFPECATQAWRTLYNHLAPQYPHQEIERLADALVTRLVQTVEDIPGGGRGLPNFLHLPHRGRREMNNAIMGFTGKNLESANFMLRWADDHPGAEGELARREAEAIIATFLRLKVDPPEAEGYNLDSGEPALAIKRHGVIYLRSFGDDMKSVARAYLREKAHGRVHDDWCTWLERFAVWLVGQQREDGSFPRNWRPVTGEVADPSPWSTYNPIPFLVHMHEITGNRTYLDSAIRAGEFCWQSGHCDFVFIGGTIDNPDIIDKEAGTLSLEAYLALHHATQDAKWIERAEQAARFSETWVYIWNVPMPEGEDDTTLHWKKGLPTIGLQLIASGHSLVDMYMAFDADEFAKLWRLTNDPHYLDVARLLLHATKTMISLPDRLFDLGGAGWQQEHWSIAPRRGYGLHRGWLPWNSTSQLAGIYDLKDLDPALYRQLVQES